MQMVRKDRNPAGTWCGAAAKGLSLGLTVSMGFIGIARLARSADPLTRLDQVADDLTRETYLLCYRYDDDEQLRYHVEIVSALETRMKDVFQATKTRSESIRTWQVKSVDTDHNTMSFDNCIESVNMWSEITGQPAVRYNSQTDDTAPPQYAHIEQSMGKPIARITMDEHGHVVARENFVPQIDNGMGGIAIPLPEQAIPVGHEWLQPQELHLRNRQQQYVTIKLRQRYKLEKVSAGVATISVRTQVLTPLTDASIRSQIVQRFCNGEIKFDIDAGRMLRRELDWNESVIGFEGPASSMKYLARFTEQLLPVRPRVARTDPDS